MFFTAECKIDSDCPFDKACINEKCLDPCDSSTHCGRNAECIVQYHRAQCNCPIGMQGNPLISCISVVCQYNEDCADHEACDRLNRVCRAVCEDDTCADTAVCVGRGHQPICSCPPATSGNPFVECKRFEQPIESRPECRSDGDCSSSLACINARCQNPCAQDDICSSSQECRVLDTLPLRTIMCQCPKDTVSDVSGLCKPISKLS